MSTRSSALLRHGALLALPFTLAACSASTTTASAGGTDAPAKAASSPADPDAGLLKGGQLKKALLSAAVLPKGYSAVKDGTLDTGDSFQDASNGPTGTCESLRSSAWIQVTGVGSVAFAQADFMNSRQEEFNEEADTFRGGAAQTAMARTSGDGSSRRRSASPARDASAEFPMAMRTFLMKRSRPVRFTGVPANRLRNAESSRRASSARSGAERSSRCRSLASRPARANLFQGQTARQTSQP